MLAALMTHMDELAKNILETESQFKGRDKYVSPNDQRRPKINEGKHVEGILSIIIHKASKNDIVLDEMNENIKVMTQLIGSHSKFI